MNVAQKIQRGERIEIWFLCEGCRGKHMVVVAGGKTLWGWNDSLEKPTFTPSILCTWNEPSGDKRCHSYVTDGEIKYLADSTHKLAGQTVPLQPIE